MTSTMNSAVSANVNFYAVNPFENPFAIGDESFDAGPYCPFWQPLNATKYSTAIRVCEDHIILNDEVPIFRVPYFDAHL